MRYLSTFVIALVACHAAEAEEGRADSSAVWRPLPSQQTGGFLGERLDRAGFGNMCLDETRLDIGLRRKAKMRYLSAFVIALVACHEAEAEEGRADTRAVWRPLPSQQTGGLFGERLDLWRTVRMPWMIDAEDDYLLSGFESHPGRHPWQGEHVGKWLHAATLAYEQTHDTKLLEAMQNVVERLLRAQEPGGYMGTYGPETRFTAMPENVSLKDVADDIAPQKKSVRPSRGWDTWTFRYNLYGLLTYERFHPDPRIVDACRRMADLLIEVYGEGKYDLTKYGTRQGISATSLLESIVMLYERTQDQKYLDFAEHIVSMSEAHQGLRLMGTMLAEGSVVGPGEGKAYQLMANLLGYLRLYRNTGDGRYLRTVQNAWQDITANHLDVAGGPWGRHMDYNRKTAWSSGDTSRVRRSNWCGYLFTVCRNVRTFSSGAQKKT